jgi:hypothetical protein
MISPDEFLERCDEVAEQTRAAASVREQGVRELNALCALTQCTHQYRDFGNVTIYHESGMPVMTGTMDEVLKALVMPRETQATPALPAAQ